MKNNFVIRFFKELSEQVSQIETPVFSGFLKQTAIILLITAFFSIFFYCISFVWIKTMIWMYKTGN